jgi:hypothetical protein
MVAGPVASPGLHRFTGSASLWPIGYAKWLWPGKLSAQLISELSAAASLIQR